MSIVLGLNQHKSVPNSTARPKTPVRAYRDKARHEIRYLNMSSALRGDVRDAHITDDQSAILPSDTQKNTVFAFAKEKGVNSIEEFGLTLGDHFITPTRKGHRSAYRNRRILLGSDRDRRRPHEHAFVRACTETRTTVVTVASSSQSKDGAPTDGPGSSPARRIWWWP